jgi:hypothetical protein
MASLPSGNLDLPQVQMAYHDLLAMVNEEKKLRKLLLTKACVVTCINGSLEGLQTEGPSKPVTCVFV